MRVFFVLMVTIAAGCSATVYSVRRPDLPCDRALRMTHRTLVALGYDINQMVAPGESGAGFIAGRKPGPNGTTLVGRVDIRCDGRGVTLQPVENGPFSKFEFSRAFDYSFAEAVKRPDLEVPAKAIGLQVLVQRLDRYQAELDLGGTPTTGDAVPVRITVRNHTDRAITIDPTGFRLTSAGESGVVALSGVPLAHAFSTGAGADLVRSELLTRSTVAAGVSVSRYLVFPPGKYQDAQVSIEDTETGESDGFVTHVE